MRLEENLLCRIWVIAALKTHALRQYQPVSESEYRAAYRMIRHFLCFCKDAGIIRSFDHEAIIKHLDQMKEEPAVPQTSILDGPQQPVQG